MSKKEERKNKNLTFLVDFIVLDIGEDRDIPIILGQSFLVMDRNLIDMENEELIFRVEDKQEIFKMYTPYKKPSNLKYCYRIDEEELPDQRRYSN